MKSKLLKLLIMSLKASFYGIALQIVFYTAICASDINAQKIESVRDVLLDIHLKDANLLDAFRVIELNTSFKFAYDQEDLSHHVQINFNKKKATVADLLLEISRVSNLKFRQINDLINVNIRKKGQKSDVIEVIIQGVTITGKVISGEDNGGLPGVNVIVKGTSQGTVTDVGGNYTLKVPDENSIIVFSSVGFVQEEVVVGARTIINMTLAPDITALEEIVVIGYGTVNKSDLTGAVGSVKSDDLIAFPTANVDQALQGRVAGVEVRSANGDPGSTPKITIRGINSPFSSSDPLFVVDGFVGGAVPPAEDVASIEVLKDASATAIYGSRGANGVILITTKSGKTGAPVIEVNTSYSLQETIDRLDLLNREQYIDLVSESDPSRVFDPNSTTDTDWQEEIYRTGHISNTQVSISGGTDAVKYFVSGGFYDQLGLVISSNYDRLTFNSNVQIKASKKIKLGANVFVRRNRSNGIVSQERTGGPIFQGVISSANLFSPTQPVFNEDGTGSLQIGDNPFNNPVSIANERVDERTSDNLQFNLKGEIKITNWLKFTTTFGYGVNNSIRGRYIPSTLVAGAPGGAADIDNRRNTNILTENYLTFSKTLNKNEFRLIAGYSYQDRVNTSAQTRGENFISDNFSYYNLSNATLLEVPGSSYSRSELLSYYGRFEYNFDSKYLFTGTLRYDGSSRLSENKKYSLFPSAGIAWNISKERFMDNAAFIDMLKLRASIGTTGNQNIRPYSTLATLETNSYTDENNNLVTALNPGQIPNSDLTWETSEQINIGLDAELFEGKLNISANAYQINTKDLLFEVDLNPIAGGRAKQFRNLGEIQNKGIELALGTEQTFGELRWSSSFNISSNRNEVVSLPNDEDFFYTAVPDHISGLSTNDPSAILRVGEPIGSFWGYIYDGVYQEADEIIPGQSFDQIVGGEKFRDIARERDADNNPVMVPDTLLDGNDRTIIGNPNPDFIYGFNNTFTYKGFDLNLFFQGSYGGDIMNFTRMELNLYSGTNNATTEALRRWTPTNTDTDVPAANPGRSGRMSSRFVEDGSYLRLKNISLGYTLPKSALDRIGISRMRVYISAQNIWTITNYSGIDPEVSYRINDTNNGSPTSQNLGLDYASYPNAKGFTAGLNLTF